MSDSILMIGTIAVVTILLRFLPFWIFNERRSTPKIIAYLGQVLPLAIMGMLVVYCLKAVDVLAYPYGIPELISCVVVVILHIWKRNTLLSVGLGTLCYMVMIQVIF